mgnify:CR=1 FL=1
MLATPDWLFTYEDVDGEQNIRIEYDREGDVLEIFFAEGAGRGLELTDEIVLRYDIQTGRPLSLIFLTFSKLMQPTEYGPESFYLEGLQRLSPTEQNKVMKILTSPPVNRYLRVSAVAKLRQAHQFTPIVYVRQQLAPVA